MRIVGGSESRDEPQYAGVAPGPLNKAIGVEPLNIQSSTTHQRLGTAFSISSRGLGSTGAEPKSGPVTRRGRRVKTVQPSRACALPASENQTAPENWEAQKTIMAPNDPYRYEDNNTIVYQPCPTCGSTFYTPTYDLPYRVYSNTYTTTSSYDYQAEERTKERRKQWLLFTRGRGWEDGSPLLQRIGIQQVHGNRKLPSVRMSRRPPRRFRWFTIKQLRRRGIID